MAGARRKLPRMHPGGDRVWAAHAVDDGVDHVSHPRTYCQSWISQQQRVLPVPKWGGAFQNLLFRIGIVAELPSFLKIGPGWN